MVDGDKDDELLYMAPWITQLLTKQNPKKGKNDNIHEEEIADDSNNWSRYIVLKSKENLVPLTKLSPLIIEKSI